MLGLCGSCSTTMGASPASKMANSMTQAAALTNSGRRKNLLFTGAIGHEPTTHRQVHTITPNLTRIGARFTCCDALRSCCRCRRWVISDCFAVPASCPRLPRKRPDCCTQCVECKKRTCAIGLDLAKRRHGRPHHHQSLTYGLLCDRRPGDHARDSCDPSI